MVKFSSVFWWKFETLKLLLSFWTSNFFYKKSFYFLAKMIRESIVFCWKYLSFWPEQCILGISLSQISIPTLKAFKRKIIFSVSEINDTEIDRLIQINKLSYKLAQQDDISDESLWRDTCFMVRWYEMNLIKPWKIATLFRFVFSNFRF